MALVAVAHGAGAVVASLRTPCLVCCDELLNLLRDCASGLAEGLVEDGHDKSEQALAHNDSLLATFAEDYVGCLVVELTEVDKGVFLRAEQRGT